MADNYQLPALPSSYKDAEPAAPSGASTAADPTTALTTPAALTLSLTGPQYTALDHIPADKRAGVQEWAKNLVRDPKFNAAWLAAYAHSIGLNTSLLDTVVENTRALDAGEVGALTIQATHLMDEVNNRIPKAAIDSKFIQRVQRAEVGFGDVVSKVKWIADKIKDALRQYQSLETPITEVRGKLQAKYDLMFQAIVLNQQLAENEDDQATKLVWQSAQMECLLSALPARVTELRGQLASPSADKDKINTEITRLNGLQPLVTKALQILKPMIFTGHNAVDRYLNLSNMAGGRALVLGLFISVGMYRWESDIVTQLQEMNQIAVGLVTGRMEEIMNQQAQNSSTMYVQAAQSYVDLLTRWTTTEQTLNKLVADTAQVRDILANGFAQLKSEYGKTSSVVQSAFDAVAKSQAEYNANVEKIAQG
jgi:hypothetical protein